ncbi:proteasome activator pa28 [Collybia nuda]|uniref:Proteasome activator pa28 n=1 Tax=Collybia nuda TaxID=64659 RepID=A0A9P5Y0L0_9AGAR|nr:proteasome activator pa28 [Collybia nuda]
MEKDLANRVEQFRKVVATSGEDIVFRRFPNKLHQFIQSTLNPDSPFHISHAEKSTDVTIYLPPSLSSEGVSQVKKRKLDNGTSHDIDPLHRTIEHETPRTSSRIVANKHMTLNVHNIVKKESEQLASMVDEVKLWVTLTMPNGDNFGVQIQEEVLAELHRAQESAFNLRDAARQDYLTRAKICSKIAKYPNVEDYALSLKEHDEKQLYLARQHLLDIRNLYAVLTDLIHKNITKIRAPKANNSVGLY